MAGFVPTGVTTAEVKNPNGNLTLTPATGSHLTLDGLNWPTQDRGQPGQFLQTNGDGGLLWAFPDLSNAISVVDEDTTFYVATNGNDVTGDGSSGSPWATIEHALAYLGNKWINSTVTVTIQVGDGTFTSTAPITPIHPCGSRIAIAGANTYSRTLSSVQSSSGSAGNWSYVLNLNSVANIAAGDYVLIKGLSGGTRPTYLSGCHYVSNVDIGNNRFTVTVKHPSASVASGAVTGTVIVVKTVLYFSQSYGFSFTGTRLKSIDKVVLKGPNPGGGNYAVGCYATNNAGAALGPTLGMSGWDQCLLVTVSAAAQFAGVLSYATYGINTQQGGAVLSAGDCVFSALTIAMYASSGGICWINTPMITGCTYGSYAERQAVTAVYQGTVEACSTYGLYAGDSGFCISGSTCTFRDNGTNTSPALQTRGNNEGYIS